MVDPLSIGCSSAMDFCMEFVTPVIYAFVVGSFVCYILGKIETSLISMIILFKLLSVSCGLKTPCLHSMSKSLWQKNYVKILSCF